MCGGRVVGKISGPSSQFCWKPKATLKKIIINKIKIRIHQESIATLHQIVLW